MSTVVENSIHDDLYEKTLRQREADRIQRKKESIVEDETYLRVLQSQLRLVELQRDSIMAEVRHISESIQINRKYVEERTSMSD